MIPTPLIKYAASKRNTIKILLLTFLISAGCFSAGSQNRTETQFPEVELSPNQLVASPLVIDIHSKGVWTAHEGELGMVSVIDGKGKKLATAIIKSKDDDWMRSGDAIFQVELQFEHTDTPDGKLVLENRLVTNEGNNQKESFEIPVRFYQPAYKTYWFGMQSEASKNFGTSYHFVKLELDVDSSFRGTEIHAPYGTDGSRCTMQGRLQGHTFLGEKSMLAEGEIYTQQLNMKLGSDGIELGYKKPSGKPVTLPELNESAYNKLVKAYEKNALLNGLNTNDRSRLKMLNATNGFGFTDQDLAKINFIELEINLDGSYQTREFLLYPYAPVFCGSGGCTLFIVNEKGEILSKTTVVKLPVYTTVSTAINPQNAKAYWKDLYVWSNGAFRKLVFKNGNYSSNASVAPAMAGENLLCNPQQFIKIMDYLDE